MDRSDFTVSEEENGSRLDRFVSAKAGVTRTQAQRLISGGAVRVGGGLCPKNHRLRQGELVEIEMPEAANAEPAPQDIPLHLLYEDRDLLILSKPAGLVVHPAAGHSDGTLVNALLYAVDDLSGIGGVKRPGIVHRLDRDTSGLMVVAKNDRSHLLLQEMVHDRRLKRMYRALVHGVPATRLGTVDAPIGRDPKDRKRMAVTGEAARPSLTNFKVIEAFSRASLLEVELVTGRTHQIRVHMSYIGHAVVGDAEYGTYGSLERELDLKRQFLHAYRLSFPHPCSGEVLDFEDPLPEDLQRALRLLKNI